MLKFSVDSRLAYTYDYYLVGDGSSKKRRDKGEGKTVLQLLNEAKKPVEMKYEEFKKMTDEEIEALAGTEKAMYSNMKFMKLICDLPEYWDGGDRNILEVFHNDEQDKRCLWGIWKDE